MREKIVQQKTLTQNNLLPYALDTPIRGHQMQRAAKRPHDDIFVNWLKQITAPKLSKALGCSRTNIHAWAARRAAPRPEMALRMIELSLDQINWEAIYLPFVRKQRSDKKRA